ncbi:MAG TPA: LysR family transcriptional regulator, partial [Gammaproteobacteria bacterium]|nr:LysR family transcriptional regulator [Gammaproteobacteria bacterium]
PAMDAYRADWPEVEMDVTLAYSFEPLPALVRGDLDLVITSDPQPLPGVKYLPLFRFQGVLVVANDHPLAGGGKVEPQQLREETLITYPVPRERLDIYRHFLDPAGVQPARRRTAELTMIILQLVANRRGVAALPDWAVAEYLERGYVRALSLGSGGMWGTLYCALPAALEHTPYMEAFVRTARTVSFRTLRGIRPAQEEQNGA